MVTLLLDSAQLEVVLSGVEHALAFRKRNVMIDRSAIAKVQLTDDAWTWLRGVPGPGTHVPGTVAIGTWKHAGAADFVLIRRHRPGVVIDLAGHDEFERIIVSTRHGLALVQALRLDVDEQAADVADLATGTIPVAPAPAKKPARKRAPKAAPATG
ncbi:hypothetical protein [Microbacterium rhizomatis]|uniref:Uncharacterized protein n=1 Tax=Microbacterium rhizomatis TaxID=1631477 RepID=A0A5J5J174_9MICO|nr:hypothetical protein [Microbacterium rhizomatis]KAA9108271.1 hypothetical protein F6B43_12810 [Microbacterium rhizomatis]